MKLCPLYWTRLAEYKVLDVRQCLIHRHSLALALPDVSILTWNDDASTML